MKQQKRPKQQQTAFFAPVRSGLGHRHCFHGIGLCCLLALQLASKGLNVLVGSLDSKDSTWIPTKKNTYSHWTLQLKEKKHVHELMRFLFGKVSTIVKHPISTWPPIPFNWKKKRKLPGKSASVSLVWSFTAVAWARVVSASMAWRGSWAKKDLLSFSGFAFEFIENNASSFSSFSSSPLFLGKEYKFISLNSCFFWIETVWKHCLTLPILNWSTLVSKIIFCSNCITALPPVLFL